MKPQPPDMSPRAVTHRLRRVAELVRVCRALAGPRRQPRSTNHQRPNTSYDPAFQPEPLITKP